MRLRPTLPVKAVTQKLRVVTAFSWEIDLSLFTSETGHGNNKSRAQILAQIAPGQDGRKQPALNKVYFFLVHLYLTQDIDSPLI